MFIDEMLGLTRESHVPEALPQVSSIARELRPIGLLLVAEDVLGDEKHAAQLGRHGELHRPSRFIEESGHHGRL